MRFKSYGIEQAPAAVTIGNFDGLHLGHRALIEQLCNRAEKAGLTSCAITFDPMPGEYFALCNNTQPPPRLLSTADRIDKLMAVGIERVLVIAFDKQLQDMSAQTFFQQILIDHCLAKLLVLGQDFHFGKERQGDIALLRRLGQQTDCTVEPVELLTHDQGKKISSSRIRQLLADNQIESANRLLGYRYTAEGLIVSGDGRGQSLGFATANLKTALPLPINGVFATLMQLPDSRVIQGVTNIGTKPTFDGKHKSCETHLFDFDENLYNQRVRLSFCRHLRAECRFDSKEQLIAQINQDARSARQYFQEKQNDTDIP